MDWPDRTWRVLVVSTDKSSLYDPCEIGPQVMTVNGRVGFLAGRVIFLCAAMSTPS